MKHLDDRKLTAKKDSDEAPAKRRGRPRKDAATDTTPADDTPRLDYTDKDAVLQELARIAERSEKESDKLAAIREISALQRMKQEQSTAEEKRVHFHLPLSVDRSLEYIVRRLKERFQMSDQWEVEAFQSVKDSFSSCLL